MSTAAECPICGKKFDRDSWEKSYLSVRSHAARSHKTGVTKEQVRGQQPIEADDEDSTEPVREGSTPLPRGRERKYPDVLEQLEQKLDKYGLGADRIERFCDVVESQGLDLDNQQHLVHAGHEIGWTHKSNRDAFVRSWCTSRGIDIPDDIADELGSPYRRRYDPLSRRRRADDYEQQKSREDLGRLSADNKHLTRALREKEQELERLQERHSSDIDKLLHEIRTKDKALEQERNRSSALEIEKLRHEMKLEMQKLKQENQKLDAESWTLNQIGRGISTIGDSMKMMTRYVFTGKINPEQLPIEEAPERERVAPSSVADELEKLNAEYVEG